MNFRLFYFDIFICLGLSSSSSSTLTMDSVYRSG
ncbi:unnamed protein product [Strongylus vulgaris]|uniref:Uncharacterized protein n=1 Tax=Strongylus vulgaris TaxID=40348 RepID=A0A3P7LQ39_STRVU|nr:unnamed protein product [Strongylus vulgaris]